MRISYLLAVLFLIPQFCNGQEKEKNWSLNGYVKNLQSVYRINLLGIKDVTKDNLIHNRLNFKYYPSDKLTIKVELRNRLFYGERSLFTQNFDENAGNDYFDLSGNIINESSILLHTMMDRLYAEYITGNWEIRLGRQRINWGINTVWNPNDIFNAYNFADFDYEERPGSDALRVTYYTSATSSVEFAVKAADRFIETTVAGLWKFNKGSYDFQLLTGYVEEDLVIGAGWAGNLGNASWKGELAYFEPVSGNLRQFGAGFSSTMAIDYSFNSGSYLNLGLLYNSLGVTTGGLESLFTTQLSAKNLYPFKYAILTLFSYPLSPLMNASITNIYSPSEAQAIFLNPSITYSLGQNFDLDFVAQLMFNNGTEGYESPVQGYFLRLKFSF